jgi:hypothetical protein
LHNKLSFDNPIVRVNVLGDASF